MNGLSDEDYRRLLGFREELRGFLQWSEEQAQAGGLTATQHQLLLAIRGHGGVDRPTVGDVARHLSLRHNSAVGLVNRAEALGLVARSPDPHDHRMVRLSLTRLGARRLARLSAQHLEELRRLRSRSGSIFGEPDPR